MYLATSSSLLVLHKDFLMAEFKFMQVKTTLDDKLNYLELINAALTVASLVASSSSKMKHLVAAAPDQAYTVYQYCSYYFTATPRSCKYNKKLVL